MYKLKYLPLAQKDLRDIINYIADNLKAPKAAMDLVSALERSIQRLQRFPYSCRVYQPIEPLDDEYRMLPVKNYNELLILRNVSYIFLARTHADRQG